MLSKFDVYNDQSKAFDMKKLREYEIQKLKYYYAIVTCDSDETANNLYEQLDGYEFELSNMKLDI